MIRPIPFCSACVLVGFGLVTACGSSEKPKKELVPLSGGGDAPPPGGVCLASEAHGPRGGHGAQRIPRGRVSPRPNAAVTRSAPTRTPSWKR